MATRRRLAEGAGSHDSESATIHRVALALLAAVNAGDVAGILACWAPTGVLLPPHHPAVEGRAAIGEYFTRLFALRRLAFTFTDARLTVAGALAVERLAYTAESTPLGGGSATANAGKGVHVYARQPDGRWLLVQDIWNSDQPVVEFLQFVE